MTVPPTQMPIFPLSDSHLHADASSPSCLSPTSAVSDSIFSWNTMAPLTNINRPPSQPKSLSPPANESKSPSDGLLFITGTTLADFKTKTNMTKVRKKAMGSYLEKEKKPAVTGKERDRREREQSTTSRTSVGSEQQDVISNKEAIRIWKGESRRGCRQTSSPVEAAPKATEASRSLVPKTTFDFVLPNAPIVTPSRTDVKLPFDETVPAPVRSIGNPFDPFRSMFQSNSPQVSVEELKFHCSKSFGSRAMGTHWMPTLVQSPHAFLSTLCIATAHYDAVNERAVESVSTLELRQEVMQRISKSLLDPQSRADDFNLIALTQLVVSEIISGEEKALSYNEQGVEAMIKQRGGLNQLGMSGRLASTISWVSLESAILREAKPQSWYSDYCSTKSSKHYPNTATVPESPLFCPRDEFETIRRSQHCTPKTLELLKEIRMMMDLFIHETRQSRRNSLSLKNIYKKLVSRSNFPSAADLQQTSVLTPDDWKYEVVRIASILTATAIINREPLSDAVNNVSDTNAPPPLYTSVSASYSNESLVSPALSRHDSVCTSFSTSPTYVTAGASTPTYQLSNPFAFAPSTSRPSFSSTTSSISSDMSNSFVPQFQAPAPTRPNALLASLKTALQSSDLSDCWGDMAGVILWVSLTAGAASRNNDRMLRKWFRALAVRASILLCFEHPEAIHASMLRMGEVVEGVGYAKTSTAIPETGRESMARPAKRRRV